MGGCDSRPQCATPRAVVKVYPVNNQPTYLKSPWASSSIVAKTVWAPRGPVNDGELQSGMWTQMARTVPVYVSSQGFGVCKCRRMRLGRMDEPYYLVTKANPLNPQNDLLTATYWEVPLVLRDPVTKETRVIVNKMKYAIIMLSPSRDLVGWLSENGGRFYTTYNELAYLNDPHAITAINCLANDYPEALESLLTTTPTVSPFSKPKVPGTQTSYTMLRNDQTTEDAFEKLKASDPSLRRYIDEATRNGQMRPSGQVGYPGVVQTNQDQSSGIPEGTVPPDLTRTAASQSLIGMSMDHVQFAEKLVGEPLNFSIKDVEMETTHCPIFGSRFHIMIPKGTKIKVQKEITMPKDHEFSLIAYNPKKVRDLDQGFEMGRDKEAAVESKWESFEDLSTPPKGFLKDARPIKGITGQKSVTSLIGTKIRVDPHEASVTSHIFGNTYAVSYNR